MCNVHYGKAASGGIDNEITRLRDGSDQPRDQAGRLGMRMDATIDLLGPSVWNAVVTPGRLRALRCLLQHQQITAAPPGAVAHAHARTIPADQIDEWKDYKDITTRELICIVPLVILAVALGVLPGMLLLNWMEPHVTGLIDSLVAVVR